MCTAISFSTLDTYFGRNLDFDFSYGERVVIYPSDRPLSFRNGTTLKRHYAIMGVAHVEGDYPLFYDAINDAGVGMAGLNFVSNAHYFEKKEGMTNIPSFELIPYILSQAKDIKEVRTLLEKVNVTNEAFSSSLPPSALHWLISDKKESLVLEITKDGMNLYENPYGALTNNPPWKEQVASLNLYRNLSNKDPNRSFLKNDGESFYSRGLGTIGLPGDLTSSSRFVRVVFNKTNCLSPKEEPESVSSFFHILGSVEQINGCCEVKENEFEYTIYTSCYNLNRGLCYIKTYFGGIKKPISFDSKECYLYPKKEE